MCDVLVLKHDVNLRYFDFINIYFRGAQIFFFPKERGKLQVLFPFYQLIREIITHNLGFLFQIWVPGTRGEHFIDLVSITATRYLCFVDQFPCYSEEYGCF